MTDGSVFSHDPTQALPISKFRAKLTSKQDVTSSVDAHCPSQNRMCGFADDTLTLTLTVTQLNSTENYGRRCLRLSISTGDPIATL